MKKHCGCGLCLRLSFQAVAAVMALSYKKDLEKYKDLDEDEILNKLSAEELQQLESALEEMDPEVRAMGGLKEVQRREFLCSVIY